MLPTGAEEEPPDFVALGQHERILAAMTEVAAERGYRKATIEAIVKRARVALSTFYEHFRDREECFLAAHDESVEAARAELAARVDRERPWPEQVATGLRALLEMAAAEPARAKLCLVETPAAGSAAVARHHAMLESVAAELREGRKLDERAARLPEGLEVAIAGGLAWLLHQRLVAGRDGELGALLPAMLQVTLTPYLGEPDARRLAAEAEVAAPSPQ